jgi:Flp pilus assembly protein TadB
MTPRPARSRGAGYLELSRGKEQMKDAPSIGADGEPQAGGAEAIFKDRGMTYQAMSAAGAAEQPDRAEDQMIVLFLLLVIAAIVLGIVGVVAKGLLYLLVIGIVVFLAALTLAALRMRRRPGRRPAR